MALTVANSGSTSTSTSTQPAWQLELNDNSGPPAQLSLSLTAPSTQLMEQGISTNNNAQNTNDPSSSSPVPAPHHHQRQMNPSPSSQGQGIPYPFGSNSSQPAPSWTPSPNAAPFYPQFNPYYPPPGTNGTPPVGVGVGGPSPVPGQPGFGYFPPGSVGGMGLDPNQQIAWAYQQMMLQQAAIAQQHHQNQFNAAMAELGRARANSHGATSSSSSAPPHTDFSSSHQAPSQPLVPGFQFQSGGTPPHSYNGSPQQSYRGRPVQGHLGTLRSNTFDNQDWGRLTAQGLPVPYTRPDAAGSSHSVSSNGSGGGPNGSVRTRTNSNNTNRSQTPPSSLRGHHNSNQSPATRGSAVPQLTTDFDRPRQQHHGRLNGSNPPSPAGSASGRPGPHQRSVSNTSSDRASASGRGQYSPTVTASNNASSISASSAAPSSANSSPNHSPLNRTNQRGPTKPSPLSQQQNYSSTTTSPADSATTPSKRAKRLSKDDSELLPQATVASALSARQSGLKGRFKRALAFNPPTSLDEHADNSSVNHGDSNPNVTPYGSSNLHGNEDQDSAITPVNDKPKSKSRAAQMFNGKFNASTDNISLSSTVSSASVMIRRLGSISKLARRNTLTNITGIFKNKDKGEGGSRRRDKKSDALEPSVTLATAELDRGDEEGLTPAAQVIRQVTLKQNAEAAKRLREQAAASSATSTTTTSASAGEVPSWEKNTANRRGEESMGSRGISEDGTLNESDNDSGDGGYDPSIDPNATIKVNGPVDLDAGEDSDGDMEVWAIGLRRSLEKKRAPGKPVIKSTSKPFGSFPLNLCCIDHVGYIQEQHLDPPNAPFAARIRSNSYQTVSESQPGPLAHLPSPDPDHIDGLQRSNSTHNTPEKQSFSLPAFNFELGNNGIDILPVGTDLPKDAPSSDATAGAAGVGGTGTSTNATDKGTAFAYTHPTANSSAPALSMFNSNERSSGLTTTASGSNLAGVKKSITFAATLSIYDTFSSSVYDRRSEPSTANRLTPALAQRIKEELNSYKMEEMEVHSASKIQYVLPRSCETLILTVVLALTSSFETLREIVCCQ